MLLVCVFYPFGGCSCPFGRCLEPLLLVFVLQVILFWSRQPRLSFGTFRRQSINGVVRRRTVSRLPTSPPFAMQTASQHLHHKRPAASGEVSPRIKVWRKTSYSTTNSLTVPFQDGSFCITTHALRIRSDHRDFLIWRALITRAPIDLHPTVLKQRDRNARKAVASHT